MRIIKYFTIEGKINVKNAKASHEDVFKVLEVTLHLKTDKSNSLSHQKLIFLLKIDYLK